MDILGILKGFWESSGLAVLTWREGVMILVSFVLLYLAIAKKFEPLLLLPIAFGILLANLPGAGLMDDPTGITDPLSTSRVGRRYGRARTGMTSESCVLSTQASRAASSRALSLWASAQ